MARPVSAFVCFGVAAWNGQRSARPSGKILLERSAPNPARRLQPRLREPAGSAASTARLLAIGPWVTCYAEHERKFTAVSVGARRPAESVREQ